MLTIAKNLYGYRELMATLAWKNIAPSSMNPAQATAEDSASRLFIHRLCPA